MLQEGLPACFSPCNSGAVCDSSRKTSHHDRDCWMSLLPGCTCVLQPLTEEIWVQLLCLEQKTKARGCFHVGQTPTSCAQPQAEPGGLADPHPPPNWCPALRPILCCAAQVTTARMKCIPGGPATAWLSTKMAPIKSFPFRRAIAHMEGRMIWVLSCGQRIPELSLEPKHALAALQMPPGIR